MFGPALTDPGTSTVQFAPLVTVGLGSVVAEMRNWLIVCRPPRFWGIEKVNWEAVRGAVV